MCSECGNEYSIKEYEELQAENEKLKAEKEELKDSCSYQVYGDMCKEREKLRKENERLKAEVKRLEDNEEFLANEQVKILDERDNLRKENTKLKCLTLHLFWKYAERLMWKCDGMYKCAPTPPTKDMYLRKCIRWEDVRNKCYKAYRKAKEELKEVK